MMAALAFIVGANLGAAAALVIHWATIGRGES